MTEIRDPLDDTKPVRTVPADDDAPLLDPDGADYPSRGGVGCGMTLIVLVITGVFALAIVGLSATAGWTSGQRAAQSNATATSGAALQSQVDRLASDLAAGNLDLADIRIQYLATNAPELAQIPQLLETGTALALTRQPTVTPASTETATSGPTESGPTITPTLEASPTLSDPYNLAERLQRAQSNVSLSQWTAAIDELDIIMGIDPNYEVATVRSLMSRALNAQALRLYRAGELGEAIFLTDRAEEFGQLEGDLGFERYVAQLFLTAKSRVGTSDYIGAINALNEVQSLSPNYQNGEVQTLLFRTYANYGDALTVSSPCSAVTQYTNALRLFSDGAVSSKRSTAQNWCEFGTPTPEGFVPTAAPDDPNEGTPAPIGQPGS